MLLLEPDAEAPTVFNMTVLPRQLSNCNYLISACYLIITCKREKYSFFYWLFQDDHEEREQLSEIACLSPLAELI